tara:strand:- start:3575 stop:3754 length:180 start_codon:yes stop_codon:yes gene_type:complete
MVTKIEIEEAIEAIKHLKFESMYTEMFLHHESMLITLMFLKKLGVNHVSLEATKKVNNK